jgi:hypothetical protein
MRAEVDALAIHLPTGPCNPFATATWPETDTLEMQPSVEPCNRIDGPIVPVSQQDLPLLEVAASESPSILSPTFKVVQFEPHQDASPNREAAPAPPSEDAGSPG